MKAIILAAGRGSRMESMTADKPKCLVKLRGKSLLDWQKTALEQAGISEIGIVTGYRRECLQSRGFEEFYNPRWSETNMVYSLAQAKKWLEAEPCIISYSDIFYQPDAIGALLNVEADLAITYDPHWQKIWEKRFDNPLDDAETFKIDPNSYLLEIGHRPSDLDQIEGQYMGLLRITPRGWQEMTRILSSLKKPERDNIHLTGLLQKTIDSGNVPIKAVPYNGNWGEIDSVSDLKAYRA